MNKYAISLWFLFTLLFFLNFKSSGQEVKNVRYVGVVRNDENLTLLNNVELFIEGFNENLSIYTDTSGNFCFNVNSREPGVITIQLHRKLFFSGNERLFFNPPQQDTSILLNFRLTPLIAEYSISILPVFINMNLKIGKKTRSEFR